MDYYNQQKEEKILSIQKIATNSKEILEALQDIENRENIALVLPYYDFITEILLAGEILTKETILKYYDFYSKSFEKNIEMIFYWFGKDINVTTKKYKWRVEIEKI